MDKEKNTNGDMQDKSAYYEGLYQDLPKEVVDILMQTHPLMGQEEKDTMRTVRSRRREDLEEVKEARMQQVGKELENLPEEPTQPGAPTRYVSRRSRMAQYSDEKEKQDKVRPVSQQKADEDDYNDGIQYVSMMPAKKKSKIVEEVTIQTMAPGKKKKNAKKEEPLPFQEDKYRYTDIDFEEKAKQENLDYLYEDDDYEEDHGVNRVAIIGGILALAVIVFLGLRCISLGSKVESLQSQVDSSVDYAAKYEEEQLKNLELQEQLDALTNPDAAGEGDTAANEDGDNSSTTGTTNTSTTGSTTYTTKEGDTFWSIAQEVYGNGAEYQKILDANNMTENTTLQPNMTLTIPPKS